MQYSPKNGLRLAGIAALSLAFITSLFVAPPGVEFTRQYVEFGLDRLLFLIVIFALLFSLKGFWGNALAFVFTLALFCLPLLYKWQTADYYSSLGGLLPMRDANQYYQGAQNLLSGFSLEFTAAYRPIFTSLLSTIMLVVGGNLQAALIALVTLNALVVYFAALEVRQTLNSGFAAALFIIIGYMFYRRFAGTLLTENLGFCLGNLALVFLLRGAVEKKLNPFLVGVFLLTTALNARAGAFFILPTLVVWAGLSFRSERGIWRPLVYATLVVATGMAANLALAKFVNASTSSTFSNYSFTLYGIAVGNKGWEQIAIDHPGASTGEIYQLTFRMIRENPAQFLKGVAGAYADYFIASKGAFSFLMMKHDRNDAANAVLWILSLAGLVSALIHGRKLEFSISFAFFLGVLFSVALVPPVDSTQMRVYAATIPMTCYVIALGAALPGKLLPGPKEQLPAGNEAGLYIPMGLSAIILASAFVLPVSMKALGQPLVPDPAVRCEAGRQKLLFVIADGSSIILLPEKGNSLVPKLDRLRFYGKLVNPEQQLSPEEKEMTLQLEPGTAITIARMVVDEFNTPASSAGRFVITQGIPQPGIYTWCVAEPQFRDFFTVPQSEYQTAAPASVSASAQDLIRAFRASGVWLIFGILYASSIGIWKLPARKIPLGILSSILVACGALMLLHMMGLLPLVWERTVVEPDNIQHRDGFMYAYNTGDSRISDTNYRDYPTYLYEDGTLLYQPHESQSFIVELGRGSYILKEKFLYFSSSNNSDPEANGRKYELEYPARIRLRYQWIGLGAGLLGFLLYIFYASPKLRIKGG